MTPIVQTLSVPAANSPVPLPAVPSGDKPMIIYVQPHKTNNADAYVGLAGMDTTTFANVIRRMDAGVGDWSITVPGAGVGGLTRLAVTDYYLSTEGTSQKFQITYWC